MRNRPAASHAVPPPTGQRGLTLIELLVAMGVLAFIAVLGWRGLDGIVRARIALAADVEQTRGMQLAFAQLQSDCAHLAGVAALSNRRPLAIGRGRLILVREVFADDQPSRLQVVAYWVGDGVLMRRESAATRDLAELDALWNAAANETGGAVALQPGVATLAMRLWVDGGWQAVAAAPSNGGASTPGGLEVVLQLQGRGDRLLKVFLLGAA